MRLLEERAVGKTIGFSGDAKKEVVVDIENEDLVSFGLIPELIGRLPVFTKLEALSHDDLINILQWPKNALIRQYKKLLRLDGVELVFTDAAITEIVKKGELKKVGARGLRAIMENVMMDIMYETPKKNIKKVYYN